MAIPPCSVSSSSALASWLLGWFVAASDDERAAMVHATYGLWLARNDAKDGKRIAAAHDIAVSTASYMAEWTATHKQKPTTVTTREVQRWAAPEPGWLKANADGAVSRLGGKGGGGVIIRGDQGDFRAAACTFIDGRVDAEMAELMACRRAVQLAHEINVQRLHLETDSLGVASMLADPNKNLSVSGPCVEEIKQMMHGFSERKVSWVRRLANSAAHKLAKVGVGDELCKIWLMVPPDFVLDVVSEEIPNFH